MMKLLLVKGAKVLASDKKYGQTALMWAAGNPAAVSLLLEYGADIRATTTTWDVKYTIYIPTTATLGKTGIPWRCLKQGGSQRRQPTPRPNPSNYGLPRCSRAWAVGSTKACCCLA
jgi:hypothetical protein